VANGKVKLFNKDFDLGADWDLKDEPALRRFELHYFEWSLNIKDYLAWKKLILSWLNFSCQQPHPASLHPYSISCRSISLIQGASRFQKNLKQDPEFLKLFSALLITCGKILRANLEKDLLANHFLKDGFGLYWLGAAFKRKAWKNLGRKIIRQQLKEQILPDGGHFERAPSYHKMVLIDLLDLLTWIKEPALKNALQKKAEKMTNWLVKIVLPDNEIPLLNDSAFNHGPATQALLQYASKVLKKEALQGPLYNHKESLIKLETSGYYIIQKPGQFKLIFDTGPLGPDYQLGHAHSDLLSFVLSFGKERFLTDTGTYCFKAGPERQFSRQTSSHNTVIINHQEQGQIWGDHRVGVRCLPYNKVKIKNRKKQISIQASRTDLKGRLVHQRQIQVNFKNFHIQIIDTCWGGLMQGFLHFHPQVKLQKLAPSRYLAQSKNHQAQLSFLKSYEVGLRKSWYFPEFYSKQKRPVLIFAQQGKPPLKTKLTIYYGKFR
jgi:hypothetical protein